MIISLPWLLLGFAFLLIIAGCWAFLRFFKDPNIDGKLPTFVALVGLVLCLLCLLVIPIDILNINSDGNWGNYHLNSAMVKYTYYTCYGSLLFVAFIFIPFAYFYHEEERMDDEPNDRLITSLKYTMASILLLILFVVVALALGFSSGKPAPDLETWAKSILEASDGGEKAAQLLIGLMALVGLFFWMIYASFGMAYLPLALCSSKPRQGREGAVAGELADVLEDIRDIECRTQLTGIRPSKQERARLERLEKRRDSLEYQQSVMHRSQVDGCAKLCGALSPLLVILGILVGIIILTLVLSMFLRALDCLIHPKDCKGSISVVSHLPNPLDTLLVLSSRIFPMDYILLCLLAILVFCASLAAISRIGVVFLWLRLHKLYRAGTSPQGLLLACEILIFIIVTFSVSIVIITPQYIAFGHQTVVVDGKVQDCTMKEACLDSSCTTCRLSQLASLVNTVSLVFPLFGVVFLWSQWLFLLAFFISAAICLFTDMPSLLEMWYPADIESVALVAEGNPPSNRSRGWRRLSDES